MNDFFKRIQRKNEGETAREKTVIACIGDSITYGDGVFGKTEETWEYYLNGLIGSGYDVVNFGVSGSTLQDEADYPYTSLKEYEKSLNRCADMYLIMLGTNDAKPQNWNAERYERELEDFARKYVELGNKPTVILMTPPTFYFEDETGIINAVIPAIINRIAEKLSLQVIDINTFTRGHREWFDDGVHPNALGDKNIAEYIAGELKLDK